MADGDRRRRGRGLALAASGAAAVAALAVIALLLAVRPAPPPGTAPASSQIRPATSQARPARTIDAPSFAVSYRVPAGWTATPYQADGQGAAESGPGGFAVLDATGAPGSSLRSTCAALPGDTVQRLYGTGPRTQITRIAGRTGCYIWPSANAPALQERRGGAAFRSAAALIPYRRLIGTGGTFQYLFITADPAHIRSIAESVLFRAGH
ncbi:MAG: hypothetical protein ACRDPY_27675 [Streptosporangiaceae bacterium]